MGDVLFPRVVQKMTPLLLVDPILANNTWADIIRACQQNKVPDSWVVGDQLNMSIGGVDYLVDIIGKNHDDYADGSGKAPLTFQLHDCYGIKYAMNSANSNVGGWANSAMRTIHLPTILALMPSAVKVGIRAVSKQTSAGNGLKEIVTTADGLFLLSEIELSGAATWSEPGEGFQYDFYKTSGNRVKRIDTTANSWWLRSPNKDNARFFCDVTTAGVSSYDTSTSSFGVAPAFCF